MLPETPSIETGVQVMFYDTDCAGVVHNLAYLRFIELARTQLAEQLGMGLQDMGRTQRFPVVVRIEVDYKRPGVLGDHLTVRGRLDSVSRSRFWFAFEIVRPSDGAVLVTSRQTCALVQMPSGKPQRLPAEWITCFGHLKGE
ncbi:MAG: thioesterase family protein [Chthoniobacteraceae bacterium]|nr:thioesterase family protein [Chthoniobacteraceae bacterium]